MLECGKAVLLGQVLKFFAKPESQTFLAACGSAAGVVACSLLFIEFMHPAMFMSHKVAMKIRISWCTLMYKKVIQFSIQNTKQLNCFFVKTGAQTKALGVR